MATPVLPLATSGGCNCCPTWINACCPYRECGISSRLILTVNGDFETRMLTSSGEVWTSGDWWTFAFGTADPRQYIAFATRAALSCENGEWKFSITFYKEGANPPVDAIGFELDPITIECDPRISGRWMLDGFEIAPNFVIGDQAFNLVEPANNSCCDCCDVSLPRYMLAPLGFGTTSGCLFCITDALFGDSIRTITICNEESPTGNFAGCCLAHFGASTSAVINGWYLQWVSENDKCKIRVTGLHQEDPSFADPPCTQEALIIGRWETEPVNCGSSESGGLVATLVYENEAAPCELPTELFML